MTWQAEELKRREALVMRYLGGDPTRLERVRALVRGGRNAAAERAVLRYLTNTNEGGTS